MISKLEKNPPPPLPGSRRQAGGRVRRQSDRQETERPFSFDRPDSGSEKSQLFYWPKKHTASQCKKSLEREKATNDEECERVRIRVKKGGKKTKRKSKVGQKKRKEGRDAE